MLHVVVSRKYCIRKILVAALTLHRWNMDRCLSCEAAGEARLFACHYASKQVHMFCIGVISLCLAFMCGRMQQAAAGVYIYRMGFLTLRMLSPLKAGLSVLR